jgi:hypothetical protein
MYFVMLIDGKWWKVPARTTASHPLTLEDVPWTLKLAYRAEMIVDAQTKVILKGRLFPDPTAMPQLARGDALRLLERTDED